jgi:hypothetical protein
MGLLVNVYKTEGRDCTNGGVSSKWNIKGLCLINVPGPFNPSEDYPAAQLVKQSFYFGDSVKIIPEECEGKQTMMGGNYAATSDSQGSVTPLRHDLDTTSTVLFLFTIGLNFNSKSY